MKLCITIFLSLFLSCVSTNNRDNQIKIIGFANEKNLDSLYSYINQSTLINQKLSIYKLGQIQDSNSLAILIPLLKNNELRSSVIFSIGQIGFANQSVSLKNRIESELSSEFLQTKNTYETVQLLRVIGKNGSQFECINTGLVHQNDSVIFESALAYAKYAQRGLFNDRSDSLLYSWLISQSDRVRWAVSHAIMRRHTRKDAETILYHLYDGNSTVRMELVRALGLINYDTKDTIKKIVINQLAQTLFHDTDWRVRVNAATSLGSFKFKLDDLKKIYFLSAFGPARDTNTHVRISIIRSIPKSYSDDAVGESDLINGLLSFYDFAVNQEKAEIAIAMAKMRGEGILNNPKFIKLCEQTLADSSQYLRARIPEALGETKSEKAIPLLRKYFQDQFLLTKNNVLDALSKIGGTKAEMFSREALDTKNPTIFSLAAANLTSFKDVDADEVSELIINAYRKIDPAIWDAESLTGLFDAIGQLKSKKSSEFLKQFLKDSDPFIAKSAARNIEKLSGEKFPSNGFVKRDTIDEIFLTRLFEKKPMATIETSKGKIELEFYMDEAPLTVMNFIKLSEKKYFNESAFHRVVPNFVIQGGDPLGTGWGGPGYSIRSEFSDLNYERGTVGMASSGKDTEGSQWFITHASQPHLDGRYSIFARVRRGMDVVDQIQIGDQIKEIRIFWPN